MDITQIKSVSQSFKEDRTHIEEYFQNAAARKISARVEYNFQ